tara:strand:- start:325 stop:483 length:159 start_codon:yes stop_codon:yes gene_type:complete
MANEQILKVKSLTISELLEELDEEPVEKIKIMSRMITGKDIDETKYVTDVIK